MEKYLNKKYLKWLSIILMSFILVACSNTESSLKTIDADVQVTEATNALVTGTEDVNNNTKEENTDKKSIVLVKNN